MRKGERQRVVVGVGHGTSTCEGAAFEYIVNLEFELRTAGGEGDGRVTYLTNEFELGDFGMGGIHLRQGGYVTPSRFSTRRFSPSAASTGSPARTSRRLRPGASSSRR